MRVIKHLLSVMCVFLVAGTHTMAAELPTVGIEAKVEVLLPGPPLKTTPFDLKSPITVRIASTRPHGSQIEYDLRYIGLVPGKYDLRTYLTPEGDAVGVELPAIPVEISGILPAEHNGHLIPHDSAKVSFFGKYKWLIIAATILWAGLLIPFLLSGRRREFQHETAPPPGPPTLAELLRPLVMQAAEGQLSTDEKAKLERMLLGHWRKQLGLESLEPPAAMLQLRAHPEAGALLRSLEDWLHRPPGTVKVDVETALAPYAQLTPDSVST